MNLDHSKIWKILAGLLVFTVLLSFLPGVVTGMSIAQALNYLVGQGYYAYADPDYNWQVTGDASIGGDLDVTGDITGNIGAFTISGVAGESLTAGHVCFLDTDDQFWRADADVSANSTGMLVMALADISASASGTFLTYGYAVNTDWSINEAAILYLSTTTGNFTETAPSGSGDVIRILGYGIGDSNTLFFNPDTSWVELE